jgi:ABC-type polysaccharide/polyol phosphate transport system ATPase subunit
MFHPILAVDRITKIFSQPPNQASNANIGWLAMLTSLFSEKQNQGSTKTFKALDDISFSLKKGESIGIIGLNGSGKSTLLQIIAGTIQPSIGNIKVCGRVAALLELGSGFNPEFTGIENIYLSASILGLSKQQIDENVGKITEFAEIGDFINQAVKTYSSGMAMRLAFAVAAHVEAEILIIDEALAVGDARFQIKCFSFLEDFQKKGGSLILVSHDLNSIAKLCETSILLHQGKLVRNDLTINVINHYSQIISEGSNESNLNSDTPVHDKDMEKADGPELLSYGGELGELNSVCINNSQKAILCAGDEFCISFNASSYSKINKPIFALRIRDSKGQEIYGTNTKFLNIKTPNLESGDSVTVKFVQKANLGVGKYFISVGFTYYDGNYLKVVHRLRECLEFEIFNEDGSFGISNCFSNVSISHNLK